MNACVHARSWQATFRLELLIHQKVDLWISEAGQHPPPLDVHTHHKTDQRYSVSHQDS